MKYHKIFRYTPSAILVADPHIRSSTPKCRTDDFLKAMWSKWDFLINTAMHINVPILLAGDIGHKDEWKNKLLTKFILHTKSQHIIAVAGQHDLPNNSLDLWSNSGTATLGASINNFSMFLNTERALNYPLYKFKIYPCPYGVEPNNISPALEDNYRTILLMHKMVIDKKLWSKQTAQNYKYFLKKYGSYDLIVTGDNHQPFVGKYKKRLLVNCGSMMRTNTKQADHRPRFYIWFAKENKVEPVYYPIEKDVISDDHIIEKVAEESRIKNYISHFNTDYDISVSFEENMKKHLQENKTEKRVRKKIKENMK